jgi:hypothetical protein
MRSHIALLPQICEIRLVIVIQLSIRERKNEAVPSAISPRINYYH